MLPRGPRRPQRSRPCVQVDPRSDLFSLGGTMLFLITGRSLAEYPLWTDLADGLGDAALDAEPADAAPSSGGAWLLWRGRGSDAISSWFASAGKARGASGGSALRRRLFVLMNWLLATDPSERPQSAADALLLLRLKESKPTAAAVRLRPPAGSGITVRVVSSEEERRCAGAGGPRARRAGGVVVSIPPAITRSELNRYSVFFGLYLLSLIGLLWPVNPAGSATIASMVFVAELVAQIGREDTVAGAARSLAHQFLNPGAPTVFVAWTALVHTRPLSRHAADETRRCRRGCFGRN